MTKVGFVGAGQMGRPMVDRLLAAGHDVTVYARRPELRDDLAAAGTHVVDTPRDAAAAGDVVIACMFSDQQLLEVSEGPEGLLAGLARGAVLASHTTGERATVRRLARAASSTGGQVVDAPVSGTAEAIREGRLTVLLGGDPDPVAACSAVVAAYAGTVVETGPLTSALAVKLVNNLMFAAHAQLAVEAVHLGRALGVDADLLLRALATCSGRSFAADTFASLPGAAEFEQAAGPFLRKDVAACSTELEASGVDAGLLREVVDRGPLDLRAEP